MYKLIQLYARAFQIFRHQFYAGLYILFVLRAEIYGLTIPVDASHLLVKPFHVWCVPAEKLTRRH